MAERFSVPALLSMCLLSSGASSESLFAQAGKTVRPYDTVGPLEDSRGRDYWLQVPRDLDEKRRYWLVVLVHGFRGKGRDILWLRRALDAFDDLLVLAPSFPEGFQLLEANTDRQLLQVFAALQKKYNLHDKLFVCGFSAGAQFSHRFAMKHPKSVIGCSAHSGGTWGPVANPKARHIPMTLSCGLDDIDRSSPGQTRSRVQAAHLYFNQLARARFHVKARLWSGVGHATSPAIERSIAECYQLATRGLFPEQAKQLAKLRGQSGRLPQSLPDSLIAPPPPKTLPRFKMNARERQIHRVQCIEEGVGGESADGKKYWIHDLHENAAGWITNEAAVAERRRTLARYLARIR